MGTRNFVEVVALAQSNGGQCLSAPADFVGTASVLRFACAVGHVWATRATNLLHRGRWCPVCGAAHSPALTLADVQQMAADRGGECLSPIYQGIHRKHLSGVGPATSGRLNRPICATVDRGVRSVRSDLRH